MTVSGPGRFLMVPVAANGQPALAAATQMANGNS